MRYVPKYNNSVTGYIFDMFNYLILGILSLSAILPFLYVLAASFTNDSEIRNRVFFIIPHHINLDAYKYIFSSDTLFRSILVSIFITIVGTILSLTFTVTMAYSLSKKNLIGRNFILNCIIFTMVFSGGIIPTYLVVKNLQLIDSYWSLWLTGLISSTSLIIVKNYFQELPESIQQAAAIDGCSELQILYKIVLPISKPILATFALFYAVSYWNNFMTPLLYINDNKKWPLQLILRQILMMSQSTLANTAQLDAGIIENPPQESMKMAVIVVAIVPIIIVYPFLQKYFSKGIMIGSIKG